MSPGKERVSESFVRRGHVKGFHKGFPVGSHLLLKGYLVFYEILGVAKITAETRSLRYATRTARWRQLITKEMVVCC